MRRWNLHLLKSMRCFLLLFGVCKLGFAMDPPPSPPAPLPEGTPPQHNPAAANIPPLPGVCGGLVTTNERECVCNGGAPHDGGREGTPTNCEAGQICSPGADGQPGVNNGDGGDAVCEDGRDRQYVKVCGGTARDIHSYLHFSHDCELKFLASIGQPFRNKKAHSNEWALLFLSGIKKPAEAGFKYSVSLGILIH